MSKLPLGQGISLSFLGAAPPFAPTIDSVSITLTGGTVGDTAGGYRLDIAGGGFDVGLTSVLIGGNAGTGLVIDDDTDAHITVPSGAACVANVTVSGPGGSNSLTNGLRYWERSRAN